MCIRDRGKVLAKFGAFRVYCTFAMRRVVHIRHCDSARSPNIFTHNDARPAHPSTKRLAIPIATHAAALVVTA
eukprot:1009927-Prymnesium_polylepis.1